MDLTQSKLKKEEWIALEVPLPESEKKILKMIYDGWDNPEISFNDANSLISMMKITDNIQTFHYNFYEMYFAKKIEELNKKYSITWEKKKEKKNKFKLKKREQIRIKNFERKMDANKEKIYEFLLLKNIKMFLSNGNNKTKSIYYYYNLSQLILNKIKNLNSILLDYVNFILMKFASQIDMKDIIINSNKNIEQNKILLKYEDVSLYKHQSDIIKKFKSNDNQLVLYQAPTGTGKTMTPIALLKKKRVVFVCAAKHIGLQLAKSCISLEIPIAIAFGCDDQEDIRLHYFAAKDYTKNYRSGSIYKVDNSVGDKVEIIICDVQSYLPAMNYMLKFNKTEDMIWYWDEPTITLDYETHDFHQILQRNWNQNKIANIVLSSATLPNMDEITEMVKSYTTKFTNSEVVEVLSYECKKSIPIISSDGYKVLPHFIFEEYAELTKSINHIERKKTILRHFDVDEISKFIIYLNKKKLVKEEFLLNNYFKNISNINIINIKLYYLLLLKECEKDYPKIYQHFKKNRKKTYESTIKITTNDAHTLTDGPTIFLTNNVEKIAELYLRVSEISNSELESIMGIINKNEKWKRELERVQDSEKQRKDKQTDEVKERAQSNTKEFQLIDKYNKNVERIMRRIKTVELQKKFVPNTKRHLKKWTTKEEITNEFTADIDDSIVEEIMVLNIENSWKILLLMGIGVFMKSNDIKYMEIMKKLAEHQKLYLIIASSDYIYGTNYQFCHGYLSKDLLNMTQEKMIQAFGRVGRQNSQMDYTLRIRDETLIKKLFLPEINKMEVINMNRLFNE